MRDKIRSKYRIDNKPSASAQIAAMEAKLAAMAKRKPADEDYIPGQGAYSGSRSESPMFGGAEDEKGNYLGDVEAEKAVEDLQREVEAGLLGCDQPAEEALRNKEARRLSWSKASQQVAGETDSTPASHPPDDAARPVTVLPPRPALRVTAAATSVKTQQAKARDEAHRRGLAALPKKPVF